MVAVLGFDPVTGVNVDQLPGTPPVEFGAVWTMIDNARLYSLPSGCQKAQC